MSQLIAAERCFSWAAMQIEVEERLLLLGNNAEQKAVFEATHDAVDCTTPADVRYAIM